MSGRVNFFSHNSYVTRFPACRTAQSALHVMLLSYYILGVRSLANASRARQFNPLNPPGVGWVPLPQTNMAAVVGRARSSVRGRACVVGHAWSCVRGRAWSVIRGRARSVVRGRAWSCPLRGQHCRDTNERTTYNNPLNPPGVGWVNFVYPIKVRVSMGTCVPNLGAIRRPVRKFCLSNL